MNFVSRSRLCRQAGRPRLCRSPVRQNASAAGGRTPPARPETSAAGSRYHLRSGHRILISGAANVVLLFRAVVRGHASKDRALVPT